MPDEQKGSEAKDSLESSLEYDSNNSTPNQPPSAPPQQVSQPPRHFSIKDIRETVAKRWSIYLPIFAALLIGLIVGAIVLYRHENPRRLNLNEQTLSPTQLNSLANSNAVVGNSNQVLTVESSSIFNGQVLIKGQLQVASQLQLAQLVVNKTLAVAGNASIQGTLTVQSGLSVNGAGSFSSSVSSPQVTTSSLQLNGDLTLTHHLVASGSIPSRSTGAAAGSGGTSSVSGSDTAGTITINTGGSPIAGCYITVNFASAFNGTPSVILTPVGSNAASLSYYVNRSSSSFSVCSNNPPQGGQSYIFDYIVIE